LVSFLLLCSLLFAYVAGLLLSIIQSAVLAILLVLGKPCLVVSLVPGVNVGKGWAKALAQVAAWSTVAAMITKLLGGHQAQIRELMLAGQITPMLKTSAQFVLLALCTLAVPVIVGMVFSGSASGVVGGIIGAGYAACKRRRPLHWRRRDFVRRLGRCGRCPTRGARARRLHPEATPTRPRGSTKRT